MSLFGIVVPALAENLVHNPSIEKATTHYHNYSGGGTATVDATYARFGRKSLKFVPNSGTGDGVSCYDTSTSIPVSASTSYNIGFWVYNPNLVPLLCRAFDQDDNGLNTAFAIGETGLIWEEVNFTVTMGGGDSGLYIAIYKDNDATTNPFWLDGFQVVGASVKHTYFDGSMENCYWTGQKHDSTSKRLPIGPGGIEYDFNDDLGIYIENWSGFGLPPITVHTQGLGFLPGGFFENTKVEMRTLSLALFANGSSLENLHTLKQQFIDAIKPDRGSKETQFQIIYKGHTQADTTVRANVFYETGMEGSQVRGFFEHFGVRFLGVDPWWYEDDQRKYLLDYTDPLDFPRINRYYEGTWGWSGGSGANSIPRGFGELSTGEIIAYGDFATVDGVGGTTYMAKINGVTPSQFNSTMMDGHVNAMAILPSDNLYVGGDFDKIPPAIGTEHNYIAYWNGAWQTMGTGPGLNDYVDDMAIDLSGNLIVVGNFTDINGGGGGTYNRIIKWDGASFSALSTGLGARGRAVVIHPVTGDYYIGGHFTTPYNYICRWSVENSAFQNVGWGGGMNGNVTGLAFAPDGTLYAIGAFTTADGNTVNKVAGWRGGNWFALGDGITTGTPSNLGVVDGNLWVAGMTEVDNMAVPYLAIWNGSAWIHPDVDDVGNQTEWGRIFQASNGAVYVGATADQGSAITAGRTNVTNAGTANAYPLLTMVGPGRLLWISNYTTGAQLHFDLTTLEDEVIVIDTRIGSRGITSSFRGPLLPRESSDFGSFYLMPGVNEIVACIENYTGNTELDLTYTPVHWSVEGPAND